MESTTNYNLFKQHESNRDIREHEEYIQKLMKSIDKENLLHLRPILVDRNYRVIDGQNRLECAKRLQVPVYYIVDDKIDSRSMFTINQNQNKWSNEDYLKFYSAEGNVNYQKLKVFMGKNKLSLNVALSLFRSVKGGLSSKNFQEGKFIFPCAEEELMGLEHLGYLRTFIEYLSSKTFGPKKYLTGPTFSRAFILFLNVKSVDFSLFMKRLPYRLDLVRPCARQSDFINIFREIYNYRNQNPLTMDDFKID